jgi:hypothetical protein
MRDNDAFLAALNEVKRKRFGSGFPSLEATTPQNEPFVLPKRIKSSGGRGSKSSSQRKKTKENVSVKPKTLLYYQHGNNSVLMKQRQRVDIIFRLWESWGWISDTETDDFDRFWEGAPRHCNITWTANTTILTILLQELIAQPYIGKQTGLAARSMVEQQFGMTANSDRKKRLTGDDEVKIRLTLLVLDIKNPLPERRAGNDDEEDDTSEAALREIFAGQLRSTKAV